ncbi:MAG: hypothetical protein ACYTG1_07685 [Planctomycetota bacterium]|jgi:hypothetical protein
MSPLDRQPLIVTTETAGSTLLRAAGRVTAVIAAAATAIATTAGGMNRAIAIVAALGIALFVLLPVLDRVTTRGTWSADASGLGFQPVAGPRRAIAWREVERVRWRRHAVDLRGGGRAIRAGGALLGADAWAALRSAVADGLRDRFAMPPPEPARPLAARLAASPRLAAVDTTTAFAVPAVLAAALRLGDASLWPAGVLLGLAVVRVAWRLVATRRHRSWRGADLPDAAAAPSARAA